MSWPGHLCPIVLLPLRTQSNERSQRLVTESLLGHLDFDKKICFGQGRWEISQLRQVRGVLVFFKIWDAKQQLN